MRDIPYRDGDSDQGAHDDEAQIGLCEAEARSHGTRQEQAGNEHLFPANPV